MTFLELCEEVARESGGTARAPTTVVGQTGRQENIVHWVKRAWTLIQNQNPNWFFLRGEFTGTLVVGQAAYTAAQIGIASRFGGFIGDYGLHQPVTLYDGAIGVEDEGAIRQIDYDLWRRRWGRGEVENNRPTEYALGPDQKIRFGAPPDDTYTVRGEYRKAPQVLAADADVPDMPEQYHDVIVWRAVKLMADKDEAVNALQLADDKYREQLANMQRDLLPRFNARAGRPLA